MSATSTIAKSTWNSIFNDIKFYTELDFAKIEFQNRGILLDNFKRMTFYYIVLKLRVFTHFGREIAIRRHFILPPYIYNK